MHLSSHPDNLAPNDRFGSASEADEHSGPFLWVCLPEKIQHDILHHAFFPSDFGEAALVMGEPSHRKHLQATAIPILLGQGNWQAYTAAARVLYSEVHLALFRYPDAAMHFLTSPTTLRLRNFVCKLQTRMDIENDLHLFDEGWRSTSSPPEARVNIPAALHSMHIHGRLCEVHFLLNVPEILYQPNSDLSSGSMSKCAVPSYYLPMARLQLAHRGLHFGKPPMPSSTLASKPGREVIAPAFLAGRAFQHGFLPLFREGVVWKSDLSLEMVLEDDQSRVEGIDAARWFRYWLGTTLLEVLGDNTAWHFSHCEWVNPFTIRRHVDDNREVSLLRRCEANVDKASTSTLADDDSDCKMLETDHPEAGAHHRRVPASRHPELIGYKSRGDDLMDGSPVRYDTSVPSSASSSVTSTEDPTMDLKTDVQAIIIKDEVMNESESTRNRTEDEFSHADGSDNRIEVLNLCLETAMSHAVMSKVMDSVEISQKCGTMPKDPGSSSSIGGEHVARSNCGKGTGVSIVTETVGDETRASVSLALHEDLDSCSSSDSSNTSLQDATCSAEITSRTDIANTASSRSGQQDSSEDSPASEASASNLRSNSDKHAFTTTSVEKAPGWRKHDCSSIISQRSQDSPESDGNSSSGGDSSSSNDEIEYTTSQPAHVQQNLVGSSTATTNPQSPITSYNPTPTALQQVSQHNNQGEANTNLKRKTSQEGLAQARKSKKARWRANRRARLLQRTAAEE